MRNVVLIGSQIKQIKHAVSPMKRENPSGKGNFGSQMKQMEQSHAACRGISPKLSKMIPKNYQYLRQRVQKAYFLQKSAEIFGHIKKKQYLCTRFSSEAARTFSSLIKRTRYNRLPFGRNASEANAIVHSYIGITPDFGSEKRGSTPRWTTKQVNPSLTLPTREGI